MEAQTENWHIKKLVRTEICAALTNFFFGRIFQDPIFATGTLITSGSFIPGILAA